MEEIEEVFREQIIGKYIVVNDIREIFRGDWDRFDECFKTIFKGLGIEKIKPSDMPEKERIFLYENLKVLIQNSTLDKDIFQDMYWSGYRYYLKQARLEHLFGKKINNNAIYVEPKEAEELYEKLKKVVLVYYQYCLNINMGELQYFYRYVNEIYKHRELYVSRIRQVLDESFFNKIHQRLNGEEQEVLSKDYKLVNKNLNSQ
jgi:hypothetical protein